MYNFNCNAKNRSNMFALKPGILVLFAIVVTEAAFLDTLRKCSIKDGECQRQLYQTVLQDISKGGIKELGIPPIDPIELKNITVPMSLFEVTMVDGIATGVKNCVFNNFETEIEKEHAFMDITCDIVIKGHYKAYSDSPLMKSIFGKSSIRGDGFVKVKLASKLTMVSIEDMDMTDAAINPKTDRIPVPEKLNLRIDYDFFVTRGPDGELYFKCKHNETQYQYNIGGRAMFHIENLYLGSADLSKYVTTFLNENGKFLLQGSGRPFMDKAMEFFYIFTHRFFDVVPTKYYIIEDLSAYEKLA